MSDNGRHRIHACAAILFRHSNAQESECTELAKERDIEAFLPVVLKRLRLNPFFDKLPNSPA